MTTLQPPAVVPGISLESQDMPDLVITKKSFSKPMSDAWAADWDRIHKAHNARLQAEELRCQEQQRLKQQVQICFWDKDASLWGREDIDTTIVLAPDQVLLVRHSVSKALRLAGQLSVSHLGMSSPVRPPSVPQSSMSSSSNSGLSSPILSRSSNPPSSPVFQVLHQIVCRMSKLNLKTSTLFHLEQTWRILTLFGKLDVCWSLWTLELGLVACMHKIWHGAVGGHQHGIKAHFEKIFQPIPYVKATWYKQLQT
ncbi:hypothetical protein L208DRAFT_1377226 [Tricholoma matsutake]|nr:hypothetical protein L208DRAFT_1377226 [Tricholoma matsutake 945]